MYDIFSVEFTPLNRKLANSLVLKIKANKSISKRLSGEENLSKSERINLRRADKRIGDLSFQLFNLMSKIVVRNINNYVSLVNNSPVTEKCHKKEEMQAECFIVLENCIENFKMNKGYCFYFYYNKSLSRNFFRYFKKRYQEKDKSEKYMTEKKYTAERSSTYSEVDLDLLISNIKFDEEEEELVRSKIKKESKDDFIEKHEGFNTAKYYSTLKRVKGKINTLKSENEII
jgi:hypothetical protein